MKLSYRALCLACDAFLLSYPPENYEEWGEDELYNWVQHMAWEPLKHYEGWLLWNVILGHAATIQQAFNEIGEVK